MCWSVTASSTMPLPSPASASFSCFSSAGMRPLVSSPAFAQYKPSGTGGPLQPWALQVLELRDGRIAHVHHFLDTRLFERFGLPAQL